MAATRTKILFICSRNQWRSPTAERIWRDHPDLDVRSAGTSPQARRRVKLADLQWADGIFVMEKKHRSQLQVEFPNALDRKPVHVLDIPDEYEYMDPELIDSLKYAVQGILGLRCTYGSSDDVG